MSNKVKNVTKELLSDYKCKLEKVTYDYLRSNGQWQMQQQVVFTRQNASTVLLYNKQTKNIILISQFRIPSFLNGNDSGMLLEVCAGIIDENETPEDCIKREIKEETGYEITEINRVFETYLSPGAVSEKVYFFKAEYSEQMKQGKGGGTDETEDIEIKEMTFDEAFSKIASGKIQDAKTIMLLQYAKLTNLMENL